MERLHALVLSPPCSSIREKSDRYVRKCISSLHTYAIMSNAVMHLLSVCFIAIMSR